MATKKTEEAVAIAQNVYPDEKLVTIKLPLTKEEREPVHVGVNDRDWIIQRGVYVKVPECVVEVLDHAEQALQDSILYQEKVQRGEE
jgi:hypothetical protein